MQARNTRGSLDPQSFSASDHKAPQGAKSGQNPAATGAFGARGQWPPGRPFAGVGYTIGTRPVARWVHALLVALALGACAPPPALAAPGDGCRTDGCKHEIRKAIHAQWRERVQPHRAWLDRVRPCESGSRGYELTTTGNGFWFAYQFTPTTWRKVAAGRVVRGIPAGTWSKRPGPLEQDYRAVLVLERQGVGAWPVCG